MVKWKCYHFHHTRVRNIRMIFLFNTRFPPYFCLIIMYKDVFHIENIHDHCNFLSTHFCDSTVELYNHPVNLNKSAGSFLSASYEHTNLYRWKRKLVTIHSMNCSPKHVKFFCFKFTGVIYNTQFLHFMRKLTSPTLL